MSDFDPFEKFLRDRPPAQLPAEWRGEILRTALESRPASLHTSARREAAVSWHQALMALFWPHPRAWAALGAAWLVIIALHVAFLDGSSREYASQAPPPSALLIEVLREQRELLAELSGAGRESESRKPEVLPPRSMLRESFAMV